MESDESGTPEQPFEESPEQPQESFPPSIPPPHPLPARKTEYRVVPFVANVAINATTDTVAAQLEQLIQYWSYRDWEYVRLESVETHIAGDNGCFGIGATSPRVTACSMVVFRK